MWDSFNEYKVFVKAHPDALQSALLLRLQGTHPSDHPDNVYPHRDIRTWAEIIPWWKEASTSDAAHQFVEKQSRILQHSQGTSVAYDNFERTLPVGWRFPNQEARARLSKLKKQYDPTGMFTCEFL
jgi:hypothetical protein